MNDREEALKLLLESNITRDLGDIEMVNRIAAVLYKVIGERDKLIDENKRYRVQFERDTLMRESIRKLLDGELVEEWSE